MNKYYRHLYNKFVLRSGLFTALFFVIATITFAQPRNIAPNATVYTSAADLGGCTGGICPALNDENFGTCGTQRMYLRINGPSTTIGAEFIEWRFPTVETFDSLIIHHASPTGRVLQGAIVQYYDGNNWITHDSFSNLPLQCVNRVGIKKLTTDRFRITLFEGTGNFNFRQIEVLEASSAANDVGITRIDSPTVFCDSIQDIYATIHNYGINQVDSVTINWEIDGVLQGTFKFLGLLDTLNGAHSQDTTIHIGNYNFPGPVELKVYTSLPNGLVDTNYYNDTLVAKLSPSLKGNYTVDDNLPASSTNFIKLADMVYALNTYGVCGPTTITVAAGTYSNQPMHFKAIPGASATNTISIIGDSSKTVVTNDIDVTGDYSVLTLDNSSYIEIKYFSLISNSSKIAAVVNFAGEAHHNTLSSSYTWVNPTATNQNFNNIIFSGLSSTQTGVGNYTNHNTVINNRIIGGGYGIRSHSHANNTRHKVYNRIIDNVIDSILYMGAKFDNEDSLEFIGNSVNMLNHATNNGNHGVNFENATNFIFSANYVWAKGYGLQIMNTAPPAPLKRRPVLSNNMLYSLRDYGFSILYVDSVDIWHNSINVEGSKEAARIHFLSTRPPVTNYDVRNNIFSSDTTVSFLSTPGSSLFVKFDNNIFYNRKGDLMDIGGVAYSDLTAAQTALSPFNSGSIQANPQFVNATDLHISGFIPFDVGDNSVGLVVDIDGDPRPLVGNSVDIGADEFVPKCPAPSIVNVDSLSLGFNSAMIKWIEWDVLDDYQYVVVSAGDSPSTGTILNTNADSAIVTGLNSNTLYDFYIRTACSRGDTSSWGGPTTFYTRSNVPYYENFDKFDPNLTSALPWPKGWEAFRHSVNDSYWGTNTGTTSAAATGPNNDHTKGDSSGVYVFVKGRNTAANPVDLISPPIYVDSNQSAVSISFWYFFHGVGVNRIEVVVDTNGVENLVHTIQGQHQTSKLAPWLKDSVAIYGYQGKNIRLKLRGYAEANIIPPAACCYSDMAIDDVRIDPLSGLDISMFDINAPVLDTTACYSSAEDVIAELKNTGSDSIDFTVDSAQVEVRISGVTSTVFHTTVSDNSLNSGTPLASGESILINMGTIDMTQSGTYIFDANVTIVSDADPNNNNLIDSLVLIHDGGEISGMDTICVGDSVTLSTSNPYGSIQWQEYDGSNWLNITNATQRELKVSPSIPTLYRVEACGDSSSYSPSFMVEVIDLTLPSIIGDTAVVACGAEGTAEVILPKQYSDSYFIWYDDSVGGNPITTAAKYYVSMDGDTVTYTDTANASSSNFDTLWVQEFANQSASASTLLITEIAMDSVNAIEIQNVSNRNVKVDGWKIVLGDDSKNLNAINSRVITLSGYWAPNQIEYWEDASGANYWGDSIAWVADEPGWAVLLNDSNKVVDFLAWNIREERDIQSIRPVVNGQPVDLRRAWTGEGIDGIALIKIPGTSITRVGDSDNNYNKDFDFKNKNLGNQDAALYTPFKDGSCTGNRAMVVFGIECIVGLQDYNLVDNFRIYPNPSHGVITIDVKTNQSEAYDIYIIDAQGKLVYKKDIIVNGAYQDQLNLSHLAKGVYYMRVQSNKATKTKKIIIQ